MSIVDDIYTAADKRGLTLADYIKHTYKGNKLSALELNIRTQLDSLRSDIEDYMIDTDGSTQDIGPSLLYTSRDKLDLMQERVRENLRMKRDELDSFSTIDISIMSKKDVQFNEELTSVVTQEESLEIE